MNSMKLVIPLHFISWKKTPNDAVTSQRQGQFTPKVKANAVPRLLSSLVWIDQNNKCNGMTCFMEFMLWESVRFCLGCFKNSILSVSFHVKFLNVISNDILNKKVQFLPIHCYYKYVLQLKCFRHCNDFMISVIQSDFIESGYWARICQITLAFSKII